METLSTPQTEVLTDLEFIFLGGTKLTHTLRESDSYEDLGDHYRLKWSDVSEDALLFKTNLLQLGRRVRVVVKGEKNAVQEVVNAIKAKEAKAQGVTGQASSILAPAAVPLPGLGISVPADLWDRSPLTR